jgi:hypothetical protein
MPLTTINQLTQAMKNGQHLQIMKSTATTTVAGTVITLWDQAGTPTAGSLAVGDTTSGLIPSSATTGAMPFVNAGSGKKLYMAQFSGINSSVANWIYYDRLWHAGSFSAAATTTFTLSSQPALTRPDANGVGAEIWLETSTTFTGSATVVTVTYTDQSGNTGHTSDSATFSTTARRMWMLPLAAGDTGVRKIESVVVSGSGDATGAFNVIILRRLCELELSRFAKLTPFDAFALGLPRVYNDACITSMCHAQTTSSGTTVGEFLLVSD